MRWERAGTITGSAPIPVPLGRREALARRGGDRPERVPFEPVITIPPPPAPPVMLPLPDADALGCFGGGDHEDAWLWQIMWGPSPSPSPLDPITGTGPTFPLPPG